MSKIEEILAAEDVLKQANSSTAPAEQRNWRNPPLKAEWEQDVWGEGSFPTCPVCGEYLYHHERCVFCGQAIVQEDSVLQDFLTPSPTERHYCFCCGGEDTVVGSRAKVNGHFHGKCENCGAVYHE